MEIGMIASELDLKLVAGADKTNNNATGGYTGDLLSDVMANAREGDIWITRQVHQNIVAVATLKDLAAIILVNSCEPAKDTLEKAVKENVVIMVSSLPAFELSGRIFNLLNSSK
ncbi:MAG TPA: hypothetical protein PLV50_10455 [Smithella sp.]|nr:hypothetical protein [Smithella sp.]HOG90951.1 hypothetical protein [Smithella sp.]